MLTCSLLSTGLDSTSSTALVSALRHLADSGKTIIAVIHQPSQHVFAAFDDLLLVSEGKQMYYGPVAEVRCLDSKSNLLCPVDNL
jgi:ABC-type multidrug transport system ATPase subunit